MATSKSASKLRTAGRVCNVGAWLIAAIGTGTIGIYVSTILPVIPLYRQYQSLSPYTFTAFTNIIATLFLIVISTLFFAILLYALGTFMVHMSGTETRTTETRVVAEEENDNEDVEDERIKVVPLPEMR